MKSHNDCTPLLITLSQVLATHKAQSTDNDIYFKMFTFTYL